MDDFDKGLFIGCLTGIWFALTVVFLTGEIAMGAFIVATMGMTVGFLISTLVVETLKKSYVKKQRQP